MTKAHINNIIVHAWGSIKQCMSTFLRSGCYSKFCFFLVVAAWQMQFSGLSEEGSLGS